MKQSDPLELVLAGSLVRPGPIGRLVRLAMGALCLWALWSLVERSAAIVTQPLSSLDELVVLIAIPIFIFNYVVNIGFSKSWGNRPLLAAATMLVLLAGIGFLTSGSFDSPIVGLGLIAWLGYFYGHLGLAFVVSALIATPGCEMRSIPELIGRASGRPSKEHHCPAAFMTKIDAWEQRRLHSAG